MVFNPSKILKIENEEKYPVENKEKTKKEKIIDVGEYIFKLEDKWKLVSHLHKSIRHGNVEAAKKAAKWIYSLDKNYARYRLAVICFEDIAGGDPELINDIMSQGWKNEDIEKNGGVEWFSNVAGSLASTVKNRFANDLCQCGLFLDEYLEKFNLNKLEDQEIEQAFRIAWDENENYFLRAIAVWRIVGTKKVPNSRLGKFDGNFDLWLESQKEHNISQTIIDCMNYGMQTQNEGSHLFLGFSEIEKNKNSTLTKCNFLDFGDIGPYCSSSIDKHTSEGKKAIFDYIKNNEFLYSYGLDKDQLLNIIGKIQFRLEGGVLNKKLNFGIEKTIEELYWKKFAKINLLTPQMYLNIRNTNKDWHKYRIKNVNYIKK